MHLLSCPYLHVSLDPPLSRLQPDFVQERICHTAIDWGGLDSVMLQAYEHLLMLLLLLLVCCTAEQSCNSLLLLRWHLRGRAAPAARAAAAIAGRCGLLLLLGFVS